MKIALISDIHGNYKALGAFLDYLKRHPADAVVSLGDYVTDGPYPERTMALLYGMREKYTCYMIRGNREDYILDNVGNKEGWKPSSANGTLYYTFQHLTEADRAFLHRFPRNAKCAWKAVRPCTSATVRPEEFGAMSIRRKG